MSNQEVVIAHDDHGLTKAHVAFVKKVAMEARGLGGFFMVNVAMPAVLPDLTSALYGPSVGDAPVTDKEVVYEVRGNRPGPSRLIDRPHRPCRRVVVIGMDKGDDGIIVFTAYGTQSESIAPREWWDSSMKPSEAVEAASYWCDHALAMEEA